jgi:hypothetical protein
VKFDSIDNGYNTVKAHATSEELKHCKSKYEKKRYRNNTAKLLTQCKKYRDENPEKTRARGKKYRDENPEKTRARGKKYRDENIDKEKLRKKKYKENNIEKIRISDKKYRDNLPKSHICDVCDFASKYRNGLFRHYKTQRHLRNLGQLEFLE